MISVAWQHVPEYFVIATHNNPCHFGDPAVVDREYKRVVSPDPSAVFSALCSLVSSL